MRASVTIGALVAVLAAAGGAQGAPGATAKRPAHHVAKPRAASVERYGTEAAYRTGPIGKGYSDRDRHVADCLASYPGYDPATDRVRVRPGVSRRCDL